MGKSSFAERMAMELAQSSNESQLQYIAAMQPSDAEMKKRISRHKEVSCAEWILLENVGEAYFDRRIGFELSKVMILFCWIV